MKNRTVTTTIEASKTKRTPLDSMISPAIEEKEKVEEKRSSPLAYCLSLRESYTARHLALVLRDQQEHLGREYDFDRIGWDSWTG